MQRIIRRAGLEPWPKLWQNLRSTRETELADRFPAHVASKWIGNSVAVATKHYLQTTEDHFTQAAGGGRGGGAEAVRNPVQQPHAAACSDGQRKPGFPPVFETCGPLQGDASACTAKDLRSMGRAGLEPATNRV